MLIKFIAVTLFSLTSSMAFAGDFKVGVSLLRTQTSTEGPTLGDTENTLLIYDLKIGYLMDNLYLGFIHDSKTVTSNSSDDKRTGNGLTVGYHNKGWFADFSYFLTMDREWGSTKLSKGTGMGFDVGYNAMLGSAFFAGAQLSYKKITYEEVNSVSQTNKETSELYPMINLGVMF